MYFTTNEYLFYGFLSKTLTTCLNFCQKILKLSWFIHAKYFLSTLQNKLNAKIQYLMNSLCFFLAHAWWKVSLEMSKKNWPQGSVHRWTPLVMKEVLPHVCTSPPALFRTRSPGRCSSPQTSPCGSGKSFWPAHSAQKLSWLRENLLCRSLSAQTQEITPSTREEKFLM